MFRMKDYYTRWLSEINVYPISESNWKSIEIEHREPIDIIERMQMENNIGERVDNKKGIYLYKNEKDEVLYVAMGDSISQSIICHFKESFQIKTGDAETTKRNRFFQANAGKLNVYYMDIDDEKNGEIIAKMLQYVLIPKFNMWI